MQVFVFTSLISSQLRLWIHLHQVLQKVPTSFLLASTTNAVHDTYKKITQRLVFNREESSKEVSYEGMFFILPSLCRLATTRLAFGLPVCSSVVTIPAVSFGKSHPVPPYALPVYPRLPFSHTLQVQSQRLTPSRRVKVGLRM